MTAASCRITWPDGSELAGLLVDSRVYECDLLGERHIKLFVKAPHSAHCRNIAFHGGVIVIRDAARRECECRVLVDAFTPARPEQGVMEDTYELSVRGDISVL